MVWSVSDLSVVTTELMAVLTNAMSDFFNANPSVPHFTFSVSGNAPDTLRGEATCQLSLYLLHVRRDPFWRNTTVVTDPVTGVTRVVSLPTMSAPVPPNPPTLRQQPLSLNLSYLLTAFAPAGYQQEQQAMSVALRAFHETPIFKTAAPPQEMTVQVEADSIEEMSRFWQAVTVPIRLSALFRVAVVFLQPTDVPAAAAPPPRQVQLAVGADFNQGVPQLYQAAADVQLTDIPPGPPADSVVAVLPPLVFVAGQGVALNGGILLGGVGLDQVGAPPQPFGLLLQVPPAAGGPVTQWDVSVATAPAVAWTTQQTASELRLVLPANYAAGTRTNPVPAPPSATPVPGLYQLTLVNRASGATSLPIPFPIAALVTAPAGVTFPAQLVADATTHLFTVTGAGFAPPPQTQVVIEAVALAATSASPPSQPGQYFVSADGTTIQFLAPSALAPAMPHQVRLRVNGVESPPSWWIQT